GRQVVVVGEGEGTWGVGIEVAGSGMLNAGGNGFVFAVSCASAGNCAAGGYYAAALAIVQAFVVSEQNGTWHTAIEVPGSGALNVGGSAEGRSGSCAPAGNRAARGGLHGRLRARPSGLRH